MAGQQRFTALVMAGSRAAGDPLAVASGVADKAFVPVDGVPMLVRVLTTLRSAPSVARIVVVGLDPSVACAAPELQGFDWGGIELIRGGETPAASTSVAIETLRLSPPILITTADHPLLTASMVEEFCHASATSGGDVTFGVAVAERVAAVFPGIRRTVHRFRDATVCGCNIFALLTPASSRAPQLWRQVESYRKQPWRMVAILGITVLLRFVLGRLALSEVGEIIDSRFGLRGSPVFLSDPAAGFDVDTIQQREVAQAYLRRKSDRSVRSV